MFELYTGIDHISLQYQRSTIAISEQRILRTDNEELVEATFNQLKEKAQKESKEYKYRGVRIYGYIVNIWPTMLMENPKKNGCYSRTIKAFSYYDGESTYE
jgi:hypothetical protein